MTSAPVTPFTFEDLSPALDTPVEIDKPLTQEDIAAAHESGHAKGFREAQTLYETQEREMLRKLMLELEIFREGYEGAIETHRQSLTNLSENLVTMFCEGVAVNRETEAAITLLNRYLDKDRTTMPATLTLSTRVDEAGIAKLSKAINDAGAAEFITLGYDDRDAGGASLKWQTGALEFSSQDVVAAISDIFQAPHMDTNRAEKKDNDHD